MGKRVIIVGGGVAGMQAAITLKKTGCSPLLIEKNIALGGKLNNWDRLFPSQTSANEIINGLTDEIASLNIKNILCGEVSEMQHDEDKIEVNLTDGNTYEADAIIIATGFDLFNATLKEEYGYGVYNNVITSADLEEMFRQGEVKTSTGMPPSSVAFLHCVGSRDLQVGQGHCSRVCCITGVKQAIEIRQALPECQVYNFYMDMRMFGPGYEELYKEAQEKWKINFIRGRISEASQTIDNRIRIKAEDTLAGRPLKLTVDMLVLLIGKKAAACNRKLAADLGLSLRESGFYAPKDNFTDNVCTCKENVFIAGTALAPKTIGEAMNDGTTAAIKAYEYLNRFENGK